MLVVTTFAVLTVGVSYLGFRVRPLRRVLEGEPPVLIEDGKPIEQNIHRERLTLEEVDAEARGRQIERLEDVRWAILETNGTISFIPKS